MKWTGLQDYGIEDWPSYKSHPSKSRNKTIRALEVFLPGFLFVSVCVCLWLINNRSQANSPLLDTYDPSTTYEKTP